MKLQSPHTQGRLHLVDGNVHSLKSAPALAPELLQNVTWPPCPDEARPPSTVGKITGTRSEERRTYNKLDALEAHSISDRSVTPARPPSLSINSAPAASRAERMAARVRGCGFRLPVSKSNRVLWPTEAATARSSRLMASIARAPRHCCGVRLEFPNDHHFLWQNSVTMAEVSDNCQYFGAHTILLGPASAAVLGLR
jgi:hypothetical protein